MQHHRPSALALALLNSALGACIAEERPLTETEIAHAICPAPLFEHAVCLCDDLAHVGALHVKSGPAGVGSIGVNGRTDLVADADVVGSWYAWGGFTATGAAIGDSLVTPGDVDIVGDVTIAGDAVIGGDLVASGRLAIRGNLALNGSESLIGEPAIAGRAPYIAPDGPPCGCDRATEFDVGLAIRAARQAAKGETSWTHAGTTELHLATGSYFVTNADVVGENRIVIDGNVSVFVEGSLASVGVEQWQLAPNATLDLFVGGNVDHVGQLVAGDAARPDAFRLYVGGGDTSSIDLVGTAAFAGSVYAPEAAINYVGDAHVVGSIFARSLASTGSLTIEYGVPVAPPSSCMQPPAPPPIL